MSMPFSLVTSTRRAACPLAVLLLVLALLGAPSGVIAQEPPGEGRIPVTGPQDTDASRAGTEARRTAIPRTPGEIVEALSWWFVVPFVGASVIAVWFASERLVVLRRGRVIPRPFVERFLEHLEQDKLDPETALRLCEENGSPVAMIFAHGVRKWGKPSVEVEQAIIDGGERQVSQLRKHLRVINGVATVTPLIGLLGTVVGMIQSFNKLAESAAGAGGAADLAQGIALALLTTAVGLLIAIPSLIIYMYLAGRVDALVMEMDDLAQQVVHLISAESLASRTAAVARTRRAPARATAGTKEKEAV